MKERSAQQSFWFQDSIRERRAAVSIQDACGDAVWIADQRTRDLIATYRKARALDGAAPHWRRVRGGAYELQTPYGLLHVHPRHGAWGVYREYVNLVHAPDGRDVLFLSLEEAQAAAELHASDGHGGDDSIGDSLGWQADE